MNTKLKTKDMVISALLIALGILIPMIFTGPPFKIVIGPYSATLMAHVPVIIAMFISPWTAVFTAIGTTLGFFITTPLIVAIRAASHIFFAIVGAYMIQKRINLLLTCTVTAIIHGVFEGIVVMIFFATGAKVDANYSTMAMTWITIFGTIAHHIVDYAIAVIIAGALARAHMMPMIPHVFKNNR